MVKQLTILMLLTILAVIFMQQMSFGLSLLAKSYQHVSHWLSYVFNGGTIGSIIRRVLALLIIPIAAGLVIQFIYWLAKRRSMPHLMTFIWLGWLLLLATVAIVR